MLIIIGITLRIIGFCSLIYTHNRLTRRGGQGGDKEKDREGIIVRRQKFDVLSWV